MRWLDGMIDRMDMTLSKLWELMKDREPRLSTIHGVAKSQKQLSDWTIQQELIMMYLDIKLFGSIPFGIHWAVLACSSFWLGAKSYALFEKLSAIIQKKIFGLYFLYNIVLVSLYIKVNQLHIYTYPHSFGFPFHLDHQKMIAQGTQPLFFLIFYSLFSTSCSTFFAVFPQILEAMSIFFSVNFQG